MTTISANQEPRIPLTHQNQDLHIHITLSIRATKDQERFEPATSGSAHINPNTALQGTLRIIGKTSHYKV